MLTTSLCPRIPKTQGMQRFRLVLPRNARERRRKSRRSHLRYMKASHQGCRWCPTSSYYVVPISTDTSRSRAAMSVGKGSGSRTHTGFEGLSGAGLDILTTNTPRLASSSSSIFWPRAQQHACGIVAISYGKESASMWVSTNGSLPKRAVAGRARG